MRSELVRMRRGEEGQEEEKLKGESVQYQLLSPTRIGEVED
jgi:hypothetical protein